MSAIRRYQSSPGSSGPKQSTTPNTTRNKHSTDKKGKAIPPDCPRNTMFAFVRLPFASTATPQSSHKRRSVSWFGALGTNCNQKPVRHRSAEDLFKHTRTLLLLGSWRPGWNGDYDYRNMRGTHKTCPDLEPKWHQDQELPLHVSNPKMSLPNHPFILGRQ